MSIAAMVDNEVARAEGQPPMTRLRGARAAAGRPEPEAAGGRTTEVVSALASYVPAEAIAAYLLLLPFVTPDTGSDDFTGRWILAGAVTILGCGYCLGYRKIAAIQTGKPFRMPWVPLVTAALAFAAWVFAIPNSPFNEFGFYTPELGGAVGTVAATVISFIGSVTGETLTYKDAQAAPAPG
jgi:hypothetical protein